MQGRSNEKTSGLACEMYSTDYAGRYPRRLPSLVPTHLKSCPTCPSAGCDTYSASFALQRAPMTTPFHVLGVITLRRARSKTILASCRRVAEIDPVAYRRSCI
jgi:hypothetical protein